MTTHSDFQPAWWLPGPHCQTLWPTLLRRRICSSLSRQRLELDDGDFLDLDWAPPGNGPVVLVVHGLEGSARSHYIGGLLGELHNAGMHAVVMHLRGCSGEPNRLARSYHAGETADLAAAVTAIRTRYPDRRIAAVGFSLGGNALLKWLAELGAAAPLSAAAAVSVPFDLAAAAQKLNRGSSRLYQYYLLRALRRSLRRKAARTPMPINMARALKATTIWEFDDLVTAPLHGFADAADYYARSSSTACLSDIQVPTLILHACDDPFLPPHAIPAAKALAPAITMEISQHGGHVGFVSGWRPWRPQYWHERRIRDYLETTLDDTSLPD
ncbi:MAG: alpha/beta hydrolase [Gammaproteobacteria bacterium SG8_47]|nr:MAG: alpha/beta hydrolase [Gammaproteobacteria bacterium SG8_47]